MIDSSYTCEHHGVAHTILDLPAGRVEVWSADPDVFATDREITQPEYQKIREILQRARVFQ